MPGRRTAPAAVALTLALTAAGCGGSSPREAEPTATSEARPAASPFDYDASRPLAVRDAGRANSNYPVVLRDVSYASGGRRVQGYLALPPGGGARPGVVYLHGSGGDRGQLLVHAMWLAGRGAVTLAITAPSAAAGANPSRGLTPGQALRRQRDLAVRDVVAVRRAIDVLRARREVDPGRLGFVGWSAGARTGAVLAGVERRIGAFVLMSGGAAPVSEYASQAPASLRPDVRRLLGSVDPLGTIARARPGTLLLQDGRQDEVVPRAALERLVAATPAGTDVRWYDAGHELSTKAYRDQLDWLVRKLRIDRPVAGALKGP